MSLAPPKPVPVTPGFRLDRYELLCPVAEGGMASVWLARQHGKHGFEKLVAVKMILPKFAQDPRFERMFLDEAGIASRIEHPNVAQILDLGEEHEILYLAMEWVDGDSISKLQRVVEKKGEKVPLGMALRILADTCGGLHFAHELRGKDDQPLGVVHRDVSQQNILINTLGIPKIIDFGIAKARDRISEETTAGMLKGKIHCMAPEQARGEKVDRRADVFSVGAILYRLIAGVPPYDGDNQLATLSLLISGRPPMPLPPAVPPKVRELVQRALSHKREGRFATAAELRDAIEGAMIDEKLATTTKDVAAFCAERLADRAEKRKKAMAYALGAAGDRARVEKVLEADAADSSSGIEEVNAKLEGALKALRPALMTEPDRIEVTVDAKEASAEPEPAESASGETSATLGSAALEMTVPMVGRRRRVVIAAGLVAVCATGALLVAVGRGEGPAAPSPAAPVSAAATAPPIATYLPPPPAESTAATQASDAGSSIPPAATSSSRATRPTLPRPRPTPPPGPARPAPDLGSYR